MDPELTQGYGPSRAQPVLFYAVRTPVILYVDDVCVFVFYLRL